MDADRQIDQMIAFIKQEAQEKAEEIRIKTDKEFMAEKLQYETQASLSIRAEHDKAVKNYEINKRIEKSKLLTESRFSLMKQRDLHMKQIRSLMIDKLKNISNDNKYKDLVKYLIAQGLQTILETNVTLQCRKSDLNIVQSVLDDAVKLYQDTMYKATNITPKVNVTIDQSNYLPPAPKSSDDNTLSCTGGVVLTANNGQIVCRNTLDHRLDIALERLKPQLRGIIWGERAKIVAKDIVKKGGVSLPK